MPPIMPAGALKRRRCRLPWSKASAFGESRKVFGKAFLLRALSPRECLTYTLSMPVHVAICGAGTQGQMEDNVRTAQSFQPLTPAELADVRSRAIVGQGVYTGPTMEYWKKGEVGARCPGCLTTLGIPA
jgi:hypothetical protein